MTHRAQLLKRILGEGQSAFIGDNIEGEDAAIAAIFLDPCVSLCLLRVFGRLRGTNSLCAVIERPYGGVDVDLVAKGVGERGSLGNGRSHCGFEKVHADWS